MGMDLGIAIAKDLKSVLEDKSDFYDYDEIKENPLMYDEYGEIIFPTDHPIDMWYARKFYDLIEKVPELNESFKDPCVIRLKKETIKKMIECYCFTPDYFGGFLGLPRLCELYQMYDQLQTQGLNLYFWNSY